MPRVPKLYQREIRAVHGSLKSERLFTHICRTCGEEHIASTPRKFYCSVECNPNKGYKTSLGDKVPCKHCGELFVKEHGNQRHCGYRCMRGLGEPKRRELIAHGRGSGICPFCGAEFLVTHGNRRFCSFACKNAMANGTKSIRGMAADCGRCGREFVKAHGRQKYCSYGCGLDERNKSYPLRSEV